jgi:hypothetical protein
MVTIFPNPASDDIQILELNTNYTDEKVQQHKNM